MVAGVIQLDFSITGVDSQTLLIAEKGVARFVPGRWLSWDSRQALPATSALALSWAPSASAVTWVSSRTLVP